MKQEILLKGEKSVVFPTKARVKDFARYLQLWFKPTHWEINDKEITFLTEHWTPQVIFNFVKGYRNEAFRGAEIKSVI